MGRQEKWEMPKYGGKLEDWGKTVTTELVYNVEKWKLTTWSVESGEYL